jgi:undecaprenyl-phosphate 4-deoxy-4-formamido-L-arabinose transferase
MVKTELQISAPPHQAQQTVWPAISVVVPVFNSQETLSLLIAELENVLNRLCQDYEIILVNDGSRDQSWFNIQSLAKDNPRVKGISLLRNYGQHNALLCGIRQARFPVTVTIDDDLQHPPSEIPEMLEKLAQGYDVVYGVAKDPPHSFLRNLATAITKRVLRSAMGVSAATQVSAFRVFRTHLRTGFENFRSPNVCLDVLLTWSTHRFSHVEVKHELRRFGTSNYTLGKLIAHTANMMTGFSTLPLQISSFLGFFMILFGLGILALVVGRYFWEGDAPSGFPFLASLIVLFSGAQLFSLGVFGEYLARIHFRMMDRPAYVIAGEINFGDEKTIKNLSAA